jgi:AraC-like DNA-binding protein
MRRTWSSLTLQAYSAGLVDVLPDTASALEALARILLHLDLAQSGQSGLYRVRLKLLAEQALAESSSAKGTDLESSREFEALLARLKSCANRLPRVQQLADELGCSPRYLDALFRRQTGKPAATYLNELRHELACDWLTNTGLKISLIAVRLGYQHPGDFTRAFRTRAGCTPRAYRQSRLLPFAPLRYAREKTPDFRHSFSGETP